MIKHTQFLLKLLQGVPFQNKLVHLLRNHVRESRLPRTRSFFSWSIQSTYLWYEDTWPRLKDYSSLLRNKECSSVLQDAFIQDWYIQLNWIINYLLTFSLRVSTQSQMVWLTIPCMTRCSMPPSPCPVQRKITPTGTLDNLWVLIYTHKLSDLWSNYI